MKFINTLNENIDLQQNLIYTPVLKMAWEELKTTLNSPITKIESNVFNKVNDYKFLQEPLTPNEIKKEISVNNDKIKINIEFNKSLPFKDELYVNTEPLFFDKKEICSFSPKKNWCSLLYYENEDNFAINISTKSDEDEIVLIKSNFSKNFNIQDEIHSVLYRNNNIFINREDSIIVPIIGVNSESDYANLLPVQLLTKKHPFLIEDLNQKINFKLNNKGAEVEAKLFMRGTLNCVPNKPKKLEFNKPFIVVLKKVDNSEPYFAMYISNTNYLQKYSKEYIDKINKEFDNKQPKLSMFDKLCMR